MSTEAATYSKIAADLPRLLRITGSTVLVISLSTFLFQDWMSVGDLERFLLLLAQTLVLASAGFGCIRFLGEPKGARTFLALAVAAVPVNFTVLAALLHSVWGSTAPVGSPPSLAMWQTGDALLLTTTAVGSLLGLAVVAAFGFLVLARRSAVRLTVLFLLGNALLLLPSREPVWVAILAVALMVLLGWQLAVAQAADAGLNTWEGGIARAVLLMPVGVLLGRNIWLYEPHMAVVTATAVVTFLLARQLGFLVAGSRGRGVLEAVSLLAATVAALGLADLLESTLFAGADAFINIASLSLSAFVYEISLRSSAAPAYRRLATGIATGGLLLSLIGFGSHWTALLCLTTGTGMVVGGIWLQQRSAFVAGVLSLLAGLSFEVIHVFAGFELGHWGALAAVGVTSVVLASLLERHGARLKALSDDWRQQFAAWEV